MVKKKESKKPELESAPKVNKPEKPRRCLRQLDASTQIVSDDASLPPVTSRNYPKLPAGYVRLDASTVVKA